MKHLSKHHGFSLKNLPYGVFSLRQDPSSQPRIATRVGDFLLDLSFVAKEALIPYQEVFFEPNLNAFMALGKEKEKDIRKALTEHLESGRLSPINVPQAWTPYSSDLVVMHLPARIGDYTDFYSSKDHARRLGALFRDKDHPLLPNWSHIPIGYHGRSSSIVVSGTPIRRPFGQVQSGASDEFPRFEKTKRLDFELEMAYFIGQGNQLGESIPLDQAQDHIFGLTLMNDWSARDFQKWEYVPLGPFTGKNFATSISPWVTSTLALEPFKRPLGPQDPKPLNYLLHSKGQDFVYDLELTLGIKTKKNPQIHVLTQSNTRYLYWSMAQQIAHHTAGGCNLNPGDLLASGTISGPKDSERGCLIEITEGGKTPLVFGDPKNLEQRIFLEDGDEIVIWAQGVLPDGEVLRLGEVSGKIIG